MPGLTLRSPQSGGESEVSALSVGTYGFQRSFTRWRWLLDPLPLELTSQVETDQPLLNCQRTQGYNRPPTSFLPEELHPVVPEHVAQPRVARVESRQRPHLMGVGVGKVRKVRPEQQPLLQIDEA